MSDTTSRGRGKVKVRQKARGDRRKENHFSKRSRALDRQPRADDFIAMTAGDHSESRDGKS